MMHKNAQHGESCPGLGQSLVSCMVDAKHGLVDHARGEEAVSKKPILVDEKELRVLTKGLDLKDKQKNEYLKARWLNYVLWWDSRAADAR